MLGAPNSSTVLSVQQFFLQYSTFTPRSCIDHGGAKLLSCPGQYLTPVLPAIMVLFLALPHTNCAFLLFYFAICSVFAFTRYYPDGDPL